jgi:hypothetical protein
MAINKGFWGVEDLADSTARLEEMKQRCGPQWDERQSVRERLLIESALLLNNPAPSVSRSSRYASYQAAMERLHEKFPSDDDVASLFALSMLIQAFPYQRHYEDRVAPHFSRAASILAAVLHRNPMHPGALHYTVHLYDTPAKAADPLAERAARRYTRIHLPHAVHMQSHLHLRLGRWADAVAANERAISLSSELTALFGSSLLHQDWHNVEFLHYCLLQQGKYARANQLVREVHQVATMLSASHSPGELSTLQLRAVVMLARQVVEKGFFGGAEGAWLLQRGQQRRVGESEQGQLSQSQMYLRQMNTSMPIVQDVLAMPSSSVDVPDGLLLWKTEGAVAVWFAMVALAARIGDTSVGCAAYQLLDRLREKVETLPERPWFQMQDTVWSVALMARALLKYHHMSCGVPAVPVAAAIGAGSEWARLLHQAAVLEQASIPGSSIFLSRF